MTSVPCEDLYIFNHAARVQFDGSASSLSCSGSPSSMMYSSCSWLLGGLLGHLVIAQSTFTPARPPSIPLAVKSPYLSTWLPVGSDGGTLPGEWPSFYTYVVTGPYRHCGVLTARIGARQQDGQA